MKIRDEALIRSSQTPSDLVQVGRPYSIRALGKIPLQEKEAETDEEDGPNMDPIEAAAIQTAKLELLAYARITLHINSEAGTSTNVVPTTRTIIPDVIPHASN
ncbi:hypothetical protein HAX54_020038 [Datura stramonium]|uniref:Uncharacterized protein n=1 Tax=Datura stramonium TaxID=4076 RepID=A0ABS8USP0_DATST|nr:hypothetical protein [Datura stramonium]